MEADLEHRCRFFEVYLNTILTNHMQVGRVVGPSHYTDHEEISQWCNYAVKDGAQNPQSSFCLKMYCKVQPKLIWFQQSK